MIEVRDTDSNLVLVKRVIEVADGVGKYILYSVVEVGYMYAFYSGKWRAERLQWLRMRMKMSLPYGRGSTDGAETGGEAS